MMTDRNTLLDLTVLTCRWIVGVVFLYACIDKLLHPTAFAQAIVLVWMRMRTSVSYSLSSRTLFTLPWYVSVWGVPFSSDQKLSGASSQPAFA